MDLFLDARSPYDNTFNFWTDYLGLSTLVSGTKLAAPACGPNSITESLKASLGLDDSPLCACGVAAARGEEERCGSPGVSIYSLLSPYEPHPCDPERDAPPYRAAFPGLDLLALERRRKQPQRSKPEPKVCVFCRNNGAPEEVYGTHILKTADGRVLCPILRAYTCPLCSASGDNAHTIKYCPLSKEQPGPRLPRGSRSVGKRLKIF
ncbi:nanos homolog 1-like [Synchiropus picturatus]